MDDQLDVVGCLTLVAWMDVLFERNNPMKWIPFLVVFQAPDDLYILDSFSIYFKIIKFKHHYSYLIKECNLIYNPHHQNLL